VRNPSIYDLIGNGWEWCSDWYRPDAYRLRLAGGVVVNPAGPESGFDPNHPHQPGPVTRGGSLLCNPDYSSNYRPAALRGTAPDSGTSHLAFPCVLS
jgi:formylglycine-generating enzyme required for sulfatase activity